MAFHPLHRVGSLKTCPTFQILAWRSTSQKHLSFKDTKVLILLGCFLGFFRHFSRVFQRSTNAPGSICFPGDGYTGGRKNSLRGPAPPKGRPFVGKFCVVYLKASKEYRSTFLQKERTIWIPGLFRSMPEGKIELWLKAWRVKQKEVHNHHVMLKKQTKVNQANSNYSKTTKRQQKTNTAANNKFQAKKQQKTAKNIKKLNFKKQQKFKKTKTTAPKQTSKTHPRNNTKTHNKSDYPKLKQKPPGSAKAQTRAKAAEEKRAKEVPGVVVGLFFSFSVLLLCFVLVGFNMF